MSVAGRPLLRLETIVGLSMITALFHPSTPVSFRMATVYSVSTTFGLQENIFKLINLKTKKHWIYKFSGLECWEQGECYEIISNIIKRRMETHKNKKDQECETRRKWELFANILMTAFASANAVLRLSVHKDWHALLQYLFLKIIFHLSPSYS